MEKKLQRSRTKKILGGVCGGLSDFLQTDVTLIRLIWAAMIFLGGFGLFFYLLCWLIIPEES